MVAKHDMDAQFYQKTYVYSINSPLDVNQTYENSWRDEK